MYQIWYRWLDGREEMRYERPISDLSLAKAVRDLWRIARAGRYKSPYFIRKID